MREERKVEPRAAPSLRKLLRVLVAGGMALAGVTAARADEKPAPPGAPGAQEARPAQKGGDEKAKQAGEKDPKKKSAEKTEKKGDERKADDDGFGVKGW